jgi:hypothetical protein
VRRDADTCVLAVSGELSLCSAGLVRGRRSKALADPGRVLVDVSGLRLTWRPAIRLFPSVLAGGNRAQTVAALKAVLPQLRAEGLRFRVL